jgi:PAS domain S-box-containing protein
MKRTAPVPLPALFEVFPGHLLLDAQLRVLAQGPAVLQNLGVVELGAPLGEPVRLLETGRPPTLADLAARAGASISLHIDGAETCLWGRLIALDDTGRWLFLGEPLPRSCVEGAAKSRAAADPVADLQMALDAQRKAFAELEMVTRRLRSQEIESRKLALIAARTDNAVILTNRSGLIEWVNTGFERLTGWNLPDVLGRKPGDFLQGPDSDPAVILQMRHAIARGAPFRVEMVNYHRTQHPYWIHIDAQPIFNEVGELTHYMAIERDISAERAAAQALRDALDHAESANQLKSRFLASVSHELRTPLTAILGFAGLIDRPFASPNDRGHWAAAIRRNGEHLLALLNDILDLSKIEAGQMTLSSTPTDPLALIEDAVAVIRPMADERGLSLTLDLPDDLPATISTDRLRFQQIILNLLTNAVKYTETGGIVVAVLLDNALPGSATLTISVIDTGMGIPADVRHLLFSPFRRLHQDSPGRIAGVGLGLSIAQKLARLLGGEIQVQSQVGTGSTFSLVLPLGLEEAMALRAVNTPVPAEPYRRGPPAPQSLQGLRVLLIEDGEENQELVSILLAEQGAYVTCADNGLLGVELVMSSIAADQPFDAILMDMMMPVMDGYTATGELRRQGVTTPIIALTAHAMSDDRQRCLSVGCNDYVSKPIVEAQLFGAITALATPNPGRPAAPPPNRLEALIQQFRAGLTDRAITIEQALDQGDLGRVERFAHDLRGSAPTFGEPDLGRQAALCEDALRKGFSEEGRQLALDLAKAARRAAAP